MLIDVITAAHVNWVILADRTVALITQQIFVHAIKMLHVFFHCKCLVFKLNHKQIKGIYIWIKYSDIHKCCINPIDFISYFFSVTRKIHLLSVVCLIYVKVNEFIHALVNKSTFSIPANYLSCGLSDIIKSRLCKIT